MQTHVYENVQSTTSTRFLSVELNSIPRSQKSRLIGFESLDSRLLMASDYRVAIQLKIFDLNDVPITRVAVGEHFKLRAYVAELNSNEPLDRDAGGYVGVHFDAKLADIVGELSFAEAYSIGRSFKQHAPGVWEDVGAQPNLVSSEFVAGRIIHLQWEALMQAKSGGEIVFQPNPSDRYGMGAGTAYDNSSNVRFGLTRLQIGDPREFPNSPWRNPRDPSDVNADGEVNHDDLNWIEDYLSTSFRVSSDHQRT